MATNQSDLKICVTQHGTVQRRHREAAMCSLPRIWPNPPGWYYIVQTWSLSQIIIHITGVWWARLPCYPALSLGFSRGVSPVRMNKFKESLHLKAQYLDNFFVLLCHSSGGFDVTSVPSFQRKPHLNQKVGLALNLRIIDFMLIILITIHHNCSPGTTTRGATTARWPLGRWGACWPSFRLKSETEM